MQDASVQFSSTTPQDSGLGRQCSSLKACTRSVLNAACTPMAPHCSSSTPQASPAASSMGSKPCPWQPRSPQGSRQDPAPACVQVHLADAPQGPPPGHGDTPGTPRGSQLSDESVLAPGHGPATPRTPRTPRYATHLYERQEHPSPGMSTTPQSRYLAGSEESPQTGSQQASIASMEASLASMYLSPGAEPRASWPGRQQPAVSPGQRVLRGQALSLC